MSGGGRAGAPASLPRTPHHLRPGQAIDERIRSLEAGWGLGLIIHDSNWSPSQSRKDNPADVAYRRVKQLFYESCTKLDQAISTFEDLAPTWPENELLGLLNGLLYSKIERKNSRWTNTVTPKTVPLKSFTASLMPTSTPHQRSLFRPGNHEGVDTRSNMVVPGSPTDVDTDEEEEVPRSPSPSARSAQRRTNRSSHVFSQPSARKRMSDSSDQSRSSPKFAKTSDRNTESRSPVSAPIQAPSLFKKPSLDMARSFYVPTSFSSTNTSFNKSVVSSQGTTTTANTSFTSYNGSKNLPGSNWANASSTVNRSIDGKSLPNDALFLEQEMRERDRQRQSEMTISQDMSQGNRSTFGSIDEDGLLDASSKVERDMGLVDTSMLGMLGSGLTTSTNSHRGQTSPIKTRHNGMPHASEMSLTASFPPLKPSTTRDLLPETVLARPHMGSKSVSPSAKHPQDITPGNSPSKESHYIRDIPKQGLFVDGYFPRLLDVPYFVFFICQRIALASSLSMTQLCKDINLSSVQSESDSFWSAIRTHSSPKVRLQKIQESTRIWSAEARQFEGFTFKGRISFTQKATGQIFKLELLPIQADKSCRFQRKFGADRFLYLSAPAFESKYSGHRFNAAEMDQIRKRWSEWLAKEEHHFLGRKWRVFHIESHKRNKGSGKDNTHDKRIVLFATEGFGIRNRCPLGSMINWFLPLALNETQSFCKAFSRLDLGLSRTVPTLVFKPSQVKYVSDKRANGEPEDTRFDDDKLEWNTIPKGKVMNDGCSQISVGAAREIWKLYKRALGLESQLPLPSAFQARIGGAKGVWMISGETFSRDPEHTSIWIEINESQLKFSPHEEDRDQNDMTFDPLRLTFEVLKYSSSPVPSELHISFIPIMVDRGVPRKEVAGFMEECLDADRTQLLDVLTDPVKAHDWMYRNGSRSCSGSDIPWQAGLPNFLEEKINFLLESGFEPKEFAYLAESFEQLIMNHQRKQQASLRTPLGKSTYLLGVADPLGLLKPGEIHVQFSTQFIDRIAEEKFVNLRNKEVLVARQPACRRSDIQKVRAVVHPELEHLLDVVVFPSRGEYPLAGKLQGGDYDGDIFWLCWEPRLVTPFKNAPAPVTDPDPEHYNISVDRRRVKDIMNTRNLQTVDVLLAKAFEFRSQPSLLGIVTVFLEKQAYKENQISSTTLDKLCDLHDLLVDASKQGYTFTSYQFKDLVHHLLESTREPKVPAYKLAMEDCKNTREGGGVSTTRVGQYKYDSSRVLDYLYFKVVTPHHKETIKRVKGLFSRADMTDEALQYPYKYLKDKDHPRINQILATLQTEVLKLYRRWAAVFKTVGAPNEKKGNSTEQENAIAEGCYRDFRALRPVYENDPDIFKPWLEPCTGPDSISWDYIRASVLYDTLLQKNKKVTFAFKMAGLELAEMKAKSFGMVRHVIPRVHANMRPRRIRAPIEQEEEEDDGSEDEYGSVFSYFSP